MSYVLHEWDVYNFEKQDNNKKSRAFQKALVAKYNSLENEIKNLYGHSEITGDLADLAKAEKNGGLSKKNIWKPNDSTEIELYGTISNFYNKNGMVTINPTHKIRLYIRNVKADRPEQLKMNSATVDSIDVVARGFLKALKIKDLKQSRKHLSDAILSQVTDAQLSAFTDAINLDKELTLSYNGVQLGLDGRRFKILKYKYADDKSEPATEFINVIFDEKNKIIGIQPVKRMGITDK